MRETPEASDQTFASVLGAAQVGAKWAIAELWVEYSPPVRAFLTARGSREPDDLTSEVFLVVFEKLATFSGDAAAFRSFVFTLAYRRLVDEVRMRSRRGESVELLDHEDPRRAPSAEDSAVERLATERTVQLLLKLPAAQADIMMLRIVADLTVEQVAQVVGKNPSAVKALQRRAIAQLRKQLLQTRIDIGASNDSDE
jgi:RNA polymerase sigma-70 factor (ECF subfamily)